MPTLISANYHYIRTNFNSLYPGIFGLTPEDFERQLLVLSGMGEFVGIKQIHDHLGGLKELPDRSIAITFDDGLAEQYELALPILQKLGIPAIFFVNTQNIVENKVSLVHKVHLLLTTVPFDIYQAYILKKAEALFGKNISMADSEKAIIHYNYDQKERAIFKYFFNFNLTISEQEAIIGELFEERFPDAEGEMRQRLYMDEVQLRHLSSIDYLGTHSHSHIPLALYRPEEIELDIAKSTYHLEKITGKKPQAISYPFGSKEACGPIVAGIASRLGLQFGFTTERAGNVDFSTPLTLARFDCNDVPGGKSAMYPPDIFFESIPMASWSLQVH